jgi:hypothetical protein
MSDVNLYLLHRAGDMIDGKGWLANTGLDLRAHHERRRHNVIGILALIADRPVNLAHSGCAEQLFGE